jgi:integrase/recombinase XerD
MKVLTSIVLDPRRELQDKTNPVKDRTKKDKIYPVKLRLTYKGERRYYGLDYYLTKADFNKVMGPKARDKYKDLKIELSEKEKKAKILIDSMPVFSFDLFKKRFFDNIDYTDLFESLKYWIKEYENQGRPGTASTFSNTLKSWQGFYKRPPLPFSSITPKLLNEYELYMKDEGKSITTVGFYLRNVRRLFNLAIKAGNVKKEFYPFGDKENELYEIPEPQNFKRALAKQDIRKIFKYNTLEGSPEQFYRDLWVFSYLSNGMNLADILRLKYKDINGDTMIFIRQKTARKRKPIPLLVEMTADIMEIIERWGTKPALPDTYVFNVLTSGLTPSVELAKVKQTTKQLNKYLKRISKSVGIKEKVTSYSARHSFATILKLSGENISYISEALGHSDTKTTANYLKSFDRDHRKKAAKKLTDW